MWRTLGLFDTWPGLIIPYMSFTLPLAIWTLSAFFREIPWEMEQAAQVDGATAVAGVPQGDRPAGGAGRVHRGDPDVLLRLERLRVRRSRSRRPTAPDRCRRSWRSSSAPTSSTRRRPRWPRPSVMVTIPIVIIVLLFQRKIVAGLTAGAVKGWSAMAAIEMKNIVKQYGDGFPAVNDVSIDVADGEFVILVGPSGCGKSTLLRMIVGLEDITSGDMIIGGERVNDKAPRDRNLAMVFQNYALYPHLTVYENIAFPLRLAKKLSDAEIDEKVRKAAQDPRARRAPRAQAGQPVGRPAPAGRHGPGDRARRRGVPLRRAAVQPRRQAARPDAHRDRPAAEAARHHDGLRHPRPDRGDDARRPGRRAEARASCSSSPRRASSTSSRSTCSSPASSARRR